MWSIIHDRGFPAFNTEQTHFGALTKNAVCFFPPARLLNTLQLCPFLARWRHTNIIFSPLKSSEFWIYCLNARDIHTYCTNTRSFHQGGHNLPSAAILSDLDGWCFPIKWHFSGHFVRDTREFLFYLLGFLWFQQKRAKCETALFKESLPVVIYRVQWSLTVYWWLSLGSRFTSLVSVGFPWVQVGRGLMADSTSLTLAELPCHHPCWFFQSRMVCKSFQLLRPNGSRQKHF